MTAEENLKRRALELHERNSKLNFIGKREDNEGRPLTLDVTREYYFPSIAEREAEARQVQVETTGPVNEEGVDDAQADVESGKTIEERIEEVENRGEDTDWEENYQELMDLYKERAEQKEQNDGITNPSEKEE